MWRIWGPCTAAPDRQPLREEEAPSLTVTVMSDQTSLALLNVEGPGNPMDPSRPRRHMSSEPGASHSLKPETDEIRFNAICRHLVQADYDQAMWLIGLIPMSKWLAVALVQHHGCLLEHVKE